MPQAVLVFDPHPAQIKREVRKFCTQIGMTLAVLEAETQWANRAELYWIDEGGDEKGHAPFRITSCPLGLLHGTASVDLSDHC